MFQGEKNEYIYTCFVINSNSIISFSEELINKVKKQGKNLYIRLTCSYPEIIKNILYILKKIIFKFVFKILYLKNGLDLK